MLVGGTGSQRKGYNVTKLLDAISKILTTDKMQNAALIGINSLGDNVTNYFNNHNENIKIVASFDFNPTCTTSDIKCYHIMELHEVIQKENITIAILAVSPDDVESITQLLIAAGIKGILNFTSVKLELPEDIFLEEFDIITSIEKIAFFSK
jgi:redox-sensing transcriptional repressor